MSTYLFPTVEKLEQRRLLAGDWQATPNPLDVDTSGLVVPLDVLLVANDLNEHGARVLPATKPEGYQGPLLDVNADGVLSALDALLIVNAINSYPDAPQLSLALTQESDLNGDEVVLNASVVYEGTTAPNTRVQADLLGTDGSLTGHAEAESGSDGRFQLSVELPTAINHLRFTATDVRGQQVATERITRLGDVTVAWNSVFLEMVRETTNVLSSGEFVKPPPPMVARFLAMLHGAMFDAMNATNPAYSSFAYHATAAEPASPIAAAAAAAHRVASSLYSTEHQLEVWDATLDEILGRVEDGVLKTRGLELGRAAADAMLEKRESDGASANHDYSVTAGAGNWKPTPPNFESPTLPQWPAVTPFALSSSDQFRPPQPPELGSSVYAEAVDEVMQLGSRDSVSRSEDQTAIADFWEDGGGTATPPGHWNQIAIDVSLSRGMSAPETSRLLALVNYALADAGISAWDAKYHYDYWRPIDAIREADDDGNSSTTADGNWFPLLRTPSFPTYTSGHSTFSAAAAIVLTELVGDDVPFVDRADRGSSGLWPPSDDVSLLAVRTFDNFWAAAEEAGVSRIYGGIHFNFDNTAGLTSGANVGQWIVAHLLTPLE